MTSASGRGDGAQGPTDHGRRSPQPVTERVGQGGPGPMIVAALVAASFMLGLVRPWDWLAAPGPTPAEPPGATATTGATAPAQPPAVRTSPPGPPPSAAAYVEPTCAYPSSWRIATISDWVGHRARTWQAAEVSASAAGPADTRLHVEPVVSTEVIALGWCAPVAGPERPPRDATGTLYRVEAGVATEVPYRRLEPAGHDALGELWVPVPTTAGGAPGPWSPGRYVIRLAGAAGSYVRWLALDVTPVPVPPIPPASPAPPVASPTP